MDSLSLYLKCSQLLGESVVDYYVLAKDQIQEIIFRGKPICVIVNTMNWNEKKVGHWIALYYKIQIDGTFCCEAFDSYGECLESYELNPCMPVSTENKLELQSSNTEVCGIWCLIYLLYKCRGKSMKQFQALFTQDSTSNDTQVVKMFKAELNRVGARNQSCVRGGQRSCSREVLKG